MAVEYLYITRPGAHINDPVSEYTLYAKADIPESVKITGRIITRIEVPVLIEDITRIPHRIGELNPAELYWSLRAGRWIEF